MKPGSESYIPTGELQGDTGNLPDKGTSTGLNGDTYGADISGDATNRITGIGGATGSESPFENMPCGPTC